MGYYKSYQFQHAFSVAMTVLASFLISDYLSHPIAYWMVLIAFLVNPITCGTSLRQSLLALLSLIFSLTNSLALLSVHLPAVFYLGWILITYVIFYYFSKHISPINKAVFYLVWLIFLVWLFFLLPPLAFLKVVNVSQKGMMAQSIILIGDALLGGIIGMIASQFIFPTKISQEFKSGLIPVLYALRHYQEGIIKTFIRQEHNPLLLLGKRSQLEYSLQTSSGTYPNWVYETGFNPGLRKGYRYFLINLEMLAEETFALASITSQNVDYDLLNLLTTSINKCLAGNADLINILIEYFAFEKLPAKKSEYMHDLIGLENSMRKIIPGNLELLDLMPDYIILVSFVHTLKDIRERLLQLVMAIFP